MLLSAAIKNNNTGEIYQMMAESADLGMTTLEQDLKRLYVAKKISLENAIVVANNRATQHRVVPSSVEGCAFRRTIPLPQSEPFSYR